MPVDKKAAARRLEVRRLLAAERVATQTGILEALAERGHRVSQTTVSRDLEALGAVKDPGTGRYRLPADGPERAGVEELAERLRQFARRIDGSANLVVVRTPPGTAHSVGVALDSVTDSGAALEDVLGCVAGDDTLLVVTGSPDGAGQLVEELERLMEGP